MKLIRLFTFILILNCTICNLNVFKPNESIKSIQYVILHTLAKLQTKEREYRKPMFPAVSIYI